jgi:hypothetical protein
MKDYQRIINDPRSCAEERLEALRNREREAPYRGSGTGEINNHIHTIYSFSPYTPSMAALKARDAGLEAAGSVDHDSIAAAREMSAACATLGIGCCVGFEIRVSFRNGRDGKPGPFARRKINNPDSEGIAYITVQGIPAPKIPLALEFLDPIRRERHRRTIKMTEAANTLLAGAGLEAIDFKRDIEDQSKYAEGGEITERHLLRAVADKLIQKYGRGPALNGGLKTVFGLSLPEKIETFLADSGNPHYIFDLLGVLKSAVLSRIFIQPGAEECVSAEKAVDFARSIGAVPAYAYLGDVGESPTGDKRAEKFEDDFIEDLFNELTRIGFQALTYMPPRNTAEQIRRIQRLCAEGGLMEISGVDINSSRQSFNCPEVLEPGCRHLVDTTWALIAHERLASADSRFGLFSPDNPLADKPLALRLAVYAAAGRDLDLKHPEESGFAIAKKVSDGRYQ